MSVARVKHSKFAARKGATLKCQKCGREIAKGETYRWWFKGFRSRFKFVRCSTCPAPRTSELESSMKADAYAAVESAQDELAALTEPGEPSDVESIVNQAGESVQEVADQYREADNGFGGGGMTVSGEIADELESAAQDLGNWSSDQSDFDDSAVAWCPAHEEENDRDRVDREECEDCQASVAEAKGEWWGEVVSGAESALDDASF